MTFDANEITDVKIDVSGETAGIGADIGDEMAEALLKAQSAEIDAHSGATITSNAVMDAASNCIAQAKGEPVVSTSPDVVESAGEEPYTSWMTPPEEVTSFEAEYTTDVCVCGHGYAGICSARELAEEGVGVIVIEKAAEENYQAVGNEFAALNAEILQKRGVPHIDPIEFYQNFMLNTQNYANQELVMKFAQNSESATNWYLSELTDEDFDTMTTAYFPEADGQLRQVGALKFWPSVCSFYGDCNQTKIQGYNRQVAIDHGAQVLFGTSAYYVIMKDGAVAGVVGKTSTGYIKINCKAAIMATGGFGADSEMMNYFFKDIKGCFIEKNGDALSSMMDSDGQGIKMAYWAGGHLETWPVPGMNMKHYSPSASVQATMPQALWLDHNCKRFCNEFYGTIEHRGRPTLFMNRDAFYVVFDSNFPEYRCHLVPQHGAWSPLNGNKESFQQELEDAYAKYKGTYVEPEQTATTQQGPGGGGFGAAAEYIVGDTIEELADNLELDATQRANFIAAVERYNSMCDAGVDSDFGRDSAVLFPVNQGPFYAVKTTPTIGSSMVTMGGLLTDGEQNVLDANMDPIPGLYASGNCCGRRFGNEYFTPIPGVSLAMAIVLGRECGRSVATFINEQ
jgi:succinate dehydrogenase/fumarate reductase flavoprotein subunit